MIFPSKWPIKTACSLLLSIITIYILSVLTLKFYVSPKIYKLIQDNSEWDEYGLSTEEIRYDLIEGLQFYKFIVSNKKNDAHEYIQADKLTVNINYLSSIINRKLFVEYIHIDILDTVLSDNFINSISNNISKNKESVKKSSFKELLSINKLYIDNLLINYKDNYKAALKNFKISIDDIKNPKNINFESQINFHESDYSIKGDIDFIYNKIKSTILFTTPSIKFSENTNYHIPGLEISSKIVINKDENFHTKANVTIIRKNVNEGDSPNIGELNFLLSYNKFTSILNLELFDLNIFNILNLEIKGKIADIRDTAQMNLHGLIKRVDNKRLMKLFSNNLEAKIDGEISNNTFNITGSLLDNSSQLNGSLDLVNISIKRNGIEFIDVNGSLKYNYLIAQDSRDSFFKLDAITKRFDIETTSIDSLETNIEYKFRKNISKGELNIHSTSDKFADGRIEFKANADLDKDTDTIYSTVVLQNVDLGKIKYENIEMSGIIKNLSSTIKGDFHNIAINTDLNISRLNLTNPRISISQIKTGKPILSNLTLPKDNQQMSLDTISLNISNLISSGIKYEDINIENIYLDIENPNILDNKSKFEIKVNGKNIFKEVENISLNNLEITASGNLADNMFSGEIRSDGGNLNDYEIGLTKVIYTYKNHEIELNDLSSYLTDLGTINIDSIKTSRDNPEQFLSNINIKNGKFSTSDNKTALSGIDLYITNNQINNWIGNIIIDEASISSVNINDLKSDIFYSSGELRITNMIGKLLDGKLTGYILHNDSGRNPGLKIILLLTDPKLIYKENTFILDSLELEYDGVYKENISLPQGKGRFHIKNLFILDYQDQSILDFTTDISTSGETLYLKNGLITNNNNALVDFDISMENLIQDNRALDLITNKIDLIEIKEFLNPLLPVFIRFGELSGNIDIKLRAKNFPKDSSLEGYIDFNNIYLTGDPFSTYFNLEDLNGRLSFDKSEIELDNIKEIISIHTKDYKEAFKYSLRRSKQESKEPTLSIKKLTYGFFNLENIKIFLKLIKNQVILKILDTKLFGGKLYASGIYNISSNYKSTSKLYVLFKNMSLQNITDSIPGTQGYISGKFNGILSLIQKGNKPNELNGLINFWTFGSKTEKRHIGRAFLERLGAKERFFLGSSKSYDKGKIHGYIKDGVITLNEMEISNTTLGIRDLNIKIHNRRNSISVPHLLSVIRETARRVETGTLDFQFQN